MIRAKVKFKEKNSEKMKFIMKLMPKLKKASVQVGIFEDAGQYDGENAPLVVEVALWNEFGTKNIPERSFFRSAIDQHEPEINQWREEAILNILDGKWTIQQAMESLGLKVQILIQNQIKSNVPPELADSTAAAKKRAGVVPNTLINTGLMLRSVTYKVTA